MKKEGEMQSQAGSLGDVQVPLPRAARGEPGGKCFSGTSRPLRAELGAPHVGQPLSQARCRTGPCHRIRALTLLCPAHLSLRASLGLLSSPQNWEKRAIQEQKTGTGRRENSAKLGTALRHINLICDLESQKVQLPKEEFLSPACCPALDKKGGLN